MPKPDAAANLDTIMIQIGKLTRPMRVPRTEPDGVVRRVTLPSLLEQLAESLPPAGGNGEGRSSGASESCLPLQTEALDALIECDRTVDHWTNTLRLTRRRVLSSDVRQIGAVAATLSEDDLADLAHDLRRLVTICATITEWEEQPWRPNGLCPMCGRRGTLRVRTSSRTGYCVACGEHWTPDTIETLGEAVRLQGEPPSEFSAASS